MMRKANAVPIRVGSRLERLLDLQRRIHVEIALEQRAERLRNPGRPTTKALKAQRPGYTTSTAERLDELGVTSLTVKRWAYDTGLIASIARGRVHREHVEAYADTHAEQARP